MTDTTARERGSALRPRYPDVVERGRVCGGDWSSPRGAPYGLFCLELKMPLQTVKVKIIVGDGLGWDHVSVSLPGRNRCPTWDEMCKVRDLFFDPSATVIQIHPAIEDYCNDHPHCLHLWHCQTEIMLVPPPITVGLGRKTEETGA